MIVTTANEVSGHHVTDTIGIVRGIVVRSPGIRQGFLGGLSEGSFVGPGIPTAAVLERDCGLAAGAGLAEGRGGTGTSSRALGNLGRPGSLIVVSFSLSSRRMREKS